MRHTVILIIGLFIMSLANMSAQNSAPLNDILFVEGQELPANEQIINTIYPVVVIYVDFVDSRLPNGQPPQDTLELQQVNLNAVGSFGWVKDTTVNPSVYRKKVRKYKYEDYWDLWFSAGEWVGTRHPDYASHEGFVWPGVPGDPAWEYKLTLYGSFRDYWSECSYGNVQIQPFQTRGGSSSKYTTGIVNNIDTVDGQRYIRWIKLPHEKSYYDGFNDPYQDMRTTLIALHNLPPGDPDRIEFDITTYTGKFAIIGAGARFGGYAYYRGQWQVMPEKWSAHGYEPAYMNNDYQGTIFAPIGDYAHEFGHNLGFYHYQGSSYELMHWGGLRRINVNCPPHINPWQKIVKGWITNLTIMRSNGQVQLPPIDSNPWVAVVSLFGDPGRDGMWGDDYALGHSEFLVIENRQRTGFNRFSGGEFVPPGFGGGGLIWHYSSMTEFQNYPPPPAPAPQLIKRIGMKTVGYGQPPYYQPPSPDHFFPWHGSSLGVATNPNSATVAQHTTGISLNNFALNGGWLTFDVNFPGTTAPSYNIFAGPTYPLPPATWTGNIYCQLSYAGAPFNLTSVAAGASAEIFGKVQSGALSFSGPQPIALRGLGYPGYRQHWGGVLVNSNGNLQVQNGATLRIDNGPLATSTGPATIQIGNDATLVIEPDASLQLNGSTNWIFGSNGKVEVYGKLELADGVTLDLPAGSKFLIQAGAQVAVGSAGIIKSQGIFHAIGSQESPISFDLKQGSSGNWQGIEIISASSGALADFKLENVTMMNVQKAIHLETPVLADINNAVIEIPWIGIEIVPRMNEVEQAAQPMAPGLFIRNTTITQACQAIIVDGYSNLLIEGCTIQGTNPYCDQMQQGIVLNNASPMILNNCVSDRDYGLRGIAQSMPILQNGYSGGYNVFSSNGIAVSLEGSSSAILGLDEGEGGQNSFIESWVYNVQLREKTYVYALVNYWGAPEPDPRLFDVDESSVLEYKNWLGDPPTGGCGTQGNHVGSRATPNEGYVGDGDGPMLNPSSLKVRAAIEARLRSDNAGALLTLKSIVTDSRESQRDRIWAVQQILAVYQSMSPATLSTYITGLQTTLTKYRQALASILPAIYLHERASEQALVAYNSNITSYPNTSTEAQGLYGKFTYRLYGMKDRSGAEALSATLQARFPTSPQALLARAQLSSTPLFSVPSLAPGMSMGTPKIEAGIPAEFNLHQNFPNPFNPTTVIKYDLPVGGYVSVKIYDVLGKEVTTLVDGETTAGYHEISFDASQLASGLYFYRMQAGGFVSTKKMMLIK